MPKQKHPIYELDGIKFYHKPSGYYKADYKKYGTLYMHVYVWEKANSPVHAACCVHHINHNRSDNRLENLELLTKSEHAKHHICKRKEENLDGMRATMDYARKYANKWHGSEEGRKWHSEHSKQTWFNREKERLVCVHCGKEFERLKGTSKRGFCSPACQSAARRASGVDSVIKQCITCGAEFSSNKYNKTKACSRSCATKAARAKSKP